MSDKSFLCAPLYYQVSMAGAEAGEEYALAIATTDENGDDADYGVAGFTMPFAGQIIAVSCDVSSPATAGRLTVTPTIDYLWAVDAALVMRAGMDGHAITVSGSASFPAGALISAHVATSGDFAGPPMALSVIVWVRMEA